jgi:hypothetical protein
MWLNVVVGCAMACTSPHGAVSTATTSAAPRKKTAYSLKITGASARYWLCSQIPSA